jgi:hypothetical protein
MVFFELREVEAVARGQLSALAGVPVGADDA